MALYATLFYSSILSVLALAGGSDSNVLKIELSQNSTVIPRYEVLEVTFQHEDNYENPFFDVSIDVTLTSPSSKRVQVGGFHYKQDLWKARFAPGELGRWTYRYSFRNAKGQTASGEGAFTCIEGRKPNRGFVRVHPENPYRFVFDDGTPYFPIGVQDCWGDNNRNGSVLDEFSMEGPFRTDLKDPPALPAGPMFVRGPSSNPQNADVFFRYFGRCGFNLYRFSQKNCSYELYRDLDHYLVQEGIMTDELLLCARRYGFRNFYGLFGYQPVLNKEPDNAEGLAKVKRFIKYSVDRWGVYVDFWEFLNEQHADDRWYEATIPYLRSIDPYRHPITTSWERPDLDGIEINAPHWYQREDELESDRVTAGKAQTWKRSGKPVVVGEQGNHIDKKKPIPGVGGVWDDRSALRMRIRNWTALFNEIAFIFWNTSYARDGHNMNIWLGPQERQYVRAMQDFAHRLDKDIRMHTVSISRPDVVRGYALASEHRAGVYLHHFKDHAKRVEDLRIEIDLPGGAKGYWYNPEDASIVKVIDITPGWNRLDVPPFVVDIALLVTPDGAPDIDNDGRPNHEDADDDEDGTPDDRDAFPLEPHEWADKDGDGIGDNLDADDDGDGTPDDENNNGIPDYKELDLDGDGVDRAGAIPWDAFPFDAKEWRDTDGDGIGDNSDPDDDNLKAPVGESSRYDLGARFEPPAGRVVHAMGQWEQYNAKLLPLLPAELRPASKLIFITIGDTPRGWRPEMIGNTIRRYDQEGFIPHIDIAPRGNQPSNAVLATLADPLFGIDHEVASTSRFDGRIQDLARIVKEFGKPVVVRIGGEFNGRWNGYHPYAYPKAFRKIVEMFRTAEVENVAFVWCYEPAAPGDFDERNAAGEYKWFPGADVIDWFAIDWFNEEDFTGPLTGGRQGVGLTPHGRSRKFLDMAGAHRKPVMIAESAPCRFDLSDPTQAEAAWRQWFEPYFAIVAERGEIKWFHLISYDWSRASYFAQTGWKNNDFTASPVLLQRLVEELRKPRYLHAGEKSLLKDYTRFAAARPSGAVSEAVRPAQAPSPRTRSQASPARPGSEKLNRDPNDKRTELAKFGNPANHLPAGGPGGTEWDAHYRSFIQSEQNALSKGFPSHAEAARQIKADAARDPENLRKHKGWVLFIKHHSQAYRPQEATDALCRLYEDLIEMEFSGPRTAVSLPFDNDPRLTIRRDIMYGRTHPDVQRLDAYLVKSAQPTPVLIEIHGGGWRGGSKSQFVYQGDLIEAVLDAGISLVSIDYRLTPAYPFPAQMEDVVRAVQLVRSKAADWNIDPNRIAAVGGSAGAHLAAWVGLHDDLAKPESPDPIERFSSRLTCFVALSGPMDLTRVDPRALAQAGVRGASFADAFLAAVSSTPEQFMTDPDIRRRLKEASPLFLVSPDDPAALIVGAGPAVTAVVPPTVPATINDPHSAWHGALLADAMRQAGVEVVARLGPDVGKDPQADAAAIVGFLRKHLKRP